MSNRIASIWHKVMTSDVGRRMARGSFWSFTGTAAARLIVLLAGIVCANLLGKEFFGQFSMVKSTINMLIIFGGTGFGITATKYISEYKKSDPRKVSSVYYITNSFGLVSGLAVMILVFCFAAALAANVLHAPELTLAMRVAAIVLFMAVFNMTQQGTLSGFEDFKSIAINTFIGSLFQSVGMIVGGWYYGVAGAVLGFGLPFLIMLVLNKWAINKNFLKSHIQLDHHAVNKNDLKILYKYSLPAILSSMLAAPTLWVIRALLIRHDGFLELANYEVGESWRAVILFVPAALTQIILPILSSVQNEGKNKFWRVTNVNILLNGGIAAAMALVVCALAGYIVGFYGQQFDDKYSVMILALSTIFSSVSSVLGVALSSLAHMWTWLLLNLLWAAIAIGLTNVFLSIGMGALGAAMAMLLSYLVHSVNQYVVLRIVTRGNA